MLRVIIMLYVILIVRAVEDVGVSDPMDCPPKTTGLVSIYLKGSNLAVSENRTTLGLLL